MSEAAAASGFAGVGQLDALRAPGVAAAAVERLARPSADFEAKLAVARRTLRAAASRWPKIRQASSLGVEDVLITALVEDERLPISVFVLDTGRLHAPTLALLRDSQQRRAQADLTPIEVFRPRPGAAEAFDAEHGDLAMRRSTELRHACCAIRKVEPLARALADAPAWVVGLRREQSSARAAVQVVDESQQPVRIAPLADWTEGDVWHAIQRLGVQTNRLHDAFFPSIGCEPCTRAVAQGEDPRAGRWWWEQDGVKECGLHAREAQRGPSALEAQGEPNAPEAATPTKELA